MDTGPKIAQVAALVGDPTRANMLAGLMDGRVRTASELAYLSGVSPPTASEHLAKLTDAGLLAPERQGRHRYFRLASPLVSQMLEGLMVVAEDGPARHRNPWRAGEALRHARSCYDHMAGRIAVRIADALIDRAYIVLGEDGGQVTGAGRAFLEEIGVSLGPVSGAGCSAGPAWTGASGARIWPAASAWRFSTSRARMNGSNGSRTVARSWSRPPGCGNLQSGSGSTRNHQQARAR